MYNITLVSTRHSDLGECNSKELYRILERIKPQVIFQEIPSTALDKLYVERTQSLLEAAAVRLYAEDHDPIIVAVDLDDIPDERFFREHRRAFESVERLRDANGLAVRTSSNRNREYTALYGFDYLNSERCISCNEAIREAIENGLRSINDDSLNSAYQAWVEITERRENEMLDNIYAYSRQYTYERAVFLLGAGHRKSIIERIQTYEKNESLELNWLV